jgi:hypothetical protein
VSPTVPGGYSVVVTSQTITPAGGTNGPVTVDGASVTLIVPAGAFPVPVQITLTASRFLGLREDLGVDPVPGFCMISCLLKGDQLAHQVAGNFPRVLVHELRRGRLPARWVCPGSPHV